MLEEISLGARLRLVLEFVREQTHVLSIASKIHSEVEGKLNSRHREYYLRQQLKAIRSELGEEASGSVFRVGSRPARLLRIGDYGGWFRPLSNVRALLPLRTF